MAQFNFDIDSGIMRISQLISGICPGMSQATLFCRVFAVPALIRDGLVPSEIGAVYTFDLCHVLPGSVTGECSPRRLSSTRIVPKLDTLSIGEPYISQWAPGLHVQAAMLGSIPVRQLNHLTSHLSRRRESGKP